MNVIKTTLDKCKTLSDGNLFINGHQELKNNNYFKGFTYNSTENCLTLTNSEYYETLGDDYVAIDSNKKYQFSITVKTNNSDAVYYAGIREFDVDKRWITPVSYRYYPNTLTTLKQDLKPGDTKIYVDNLSNWRDSNSWGWRNVIFWNYKDSTGYEYPPETYSQNTIFDAWDYNTEALDKINNIIKLKSSWSGETIPIGTKISEDHAANWSNYGILPAIKITDSYQTYSVVITGTDLKSTDSIDMFRPASKYVKFIFLSNYYGTAKPTTIYVKDITMREVK